MKIFTSFFVMGDVKIFANSLIFCKLEGISPYHIFLDIFAKSSYLSPSHSNVLDVNFSHTVKQLLKNYGSK